ncbi:MAG: NAD(P)-dependent oxidoreductase [Candidatus Hydrogenedentes bacterium]|nr:NAD(P)-dependent oxidoreductase [Candidatus Hydrogenedentota bacterium]
MAKRLLITGANGFVAGSIVKQADASWELHAVSRGPAAFERENLRWHTVSSFDEESLHDLFHDVEPDAVIHTAALADIDYCQANQDEAVAVNVDYTRILSTLCCDHDAKMVHLSTDNVFDGEKGNYDESDPVNPVNFYGETKVRSEWAVSASRCRAVVGRVALVMGLPMIGAGNSFVSRMVATLEAGRDVTAPANEIRSPVDVVTLGQALLELAGNDWTGCMHLSGSDRLSRLEMMRRIARRLGYSESKIVAHDPASIPGRAERPRDVSLRNMKARARLKTPMVDLERGMELMLGARGF